MDHPCDHINDAVLPAAPLEESARVGTSISVTPDIHVPSLQQGTSAFQVPSHSQHEDYLPQLTEEQKEELMSLHTHLTSQENRVDQVTSFEFEEPRNQTDVYNEIFKEPQDKGNSSNAIWGPELQGESDDSKLSISQEESDDQEEWTPPGKRKQGRPIAKSNVNSIELLQGDSDQEEWTPESDRGKRKQGRPIAKSNVNSTELLQGDSDQEEWTPESDRGKSKQGRPKSNVKRKYTKRNSAKTQDRKGSSK